jgi:hypothetical protein
MNPIALITWHLTPSGVFTIKSLYEEYMNGDTILTEVFVEIEVFFENYDSNVVPSQKSFSYKGQHIKTKLGRV